ncbi:MAG: carboxypeptidase regulatory-like domain-containing protein [Verrucomicrobia bacterium]|nr:carboxypeptidase regulatory-like domain-containing protein [Verrucomicrobiota bacterium]
MKVRIVCLILGLVALCSIELARADGTETLGTPSIAIASGTGVAAGGIGMINPPTPPWIITVEVPVGATIKQVLLYWEGFMGDSSPGDNKILVADSSLQAVEVTGTLIGGPTYFFSQNSSQAWASTFRADITSLGLFTAGANILFVDGLSFSFANNGAGVLVIYDDGTTAAQIEIRDGSDLAYGGFADPLQNTVAQTFNFPASPAARTAQLNMFFASVSGTLSGYGRVRPSAIEITTGGTTTVLDNLLDSVDGEEWDTLPVSVNVPAGATSLTVQAFSRDDLGIGNLVASFDWLATSLTLPLPPQPAAIGDFVWLDQNNNGIQDPNEPGVPGVTVQLMNCAGTVLATTTTDANGYYLFPQLTPGDYNVRFVLPAGYVFSPRDQGADDAKDSDADPATGMTICTTLVAGETDLTWDAGLVLPCVPATLTLTGNSATCGTLGNVRTFTVNGVSVKASAFSRTTSGTWASAYLGAYSHGLGVTDSSEGDGSNNRHTVDNLDRMNYVLLEFSKPVVVSRVGLGYVVSDSDLRVWIGTAADPFNKHLTLSDGVLSGLGYTEDNLTANANPRVASINAGEVSGNVLVVAALPGGSNDQFKINKLDVCVPAGPCAPALAVTMACSSPSTNGQPMTFNGTVSNTGSSVVTNITVTHSLAGQLMVIGSLGANASVNYSGSFTPPACGLDITTTVTARGRAVCDNSEVSAEASSTCSMPCPPVAPGTGTPGYWKNHPETWPVDKIMIGATIFTKAQAIQMMQQSVNGDKRRTLFNALVCAKLNVLIGNEGSCVAKTIILADQWFVTYGATPVKASSSAWRKGEPLSLMLDNYNNGLLCAPHRG